MLIFTDEVSSQCLKMSVFELVTELCLKVFDAEFRKEWRPDLPKFRLKTIKKLRSKCYEILLNKVNKVPIANSNYESDWSPVAQVIGHMLTLQEQHMFGDANKMEKCARKVLETNLHQDPIMVSVLELLLRLQDSVPRREDYVPVLFKYERTKPYDPAQGVAPYDIIHPSAFQPPPWMLHLARPSASHPGYFPESGRFPFDSEPGQDLPLLSRFLQPARLDGAGSRVALYSVPVFPILKEPRGLQIPPPLQESKPSIGERHAPPSRVASPSVSPCGRSQPENLARTADEIWEAALTFDPPRLRTWETFGQRIALKERPFLTEAGQAAAKHFLRVTEEDPGCARAAAASRPLPAQQLLQHLTHLLLGLETSTFPFSEEEFAFSVWPGVCMEDLSASALSSFCRELLEIGTCARRLHILFEKGAPGQPRTQLMEALREHVGVYLQFHWAAVLLMPKGTLLTSLHHWAHALHRKTVALARLCGIAPASSSWDGPCRLPSGVALMSHIYDALGEETHSDVCCVLYSTLQSVSRVYFRFLQRWIFEGILFDPWEEFFVQAVPLKHPQACRDRRDWSQAYRVVHGAVPGFLRGLEDDILLCGKTVHLLKLCCPKAALCAALRSGTPPVACCLRRRELRALSARCRRFEARVRAQEQAEAQAGQRGEARAPWRRREEAAAASEAEAQARRDAVQQAHERHVLRFKLEQEAGRRATAQQQLQWRRELQRQAAEARERRAEERREQRREEQAALQHAQRRLDDDARRAQLERQRMIEYYEELSEIVTKRKELADWKLQRTNLQERREEFILNDRKQCRAAAAELNLKNTEHSLSMGPPTIMEEEGDVAAEADNVNEIHASALTLPLANTNGDALETQESPNNNTVDNILEKADVNENVENSLLDGCQTTFISTERNLLDTSIEDAALGNVLIPMHCHDTGTSNEAIVDNAAITATLLQTNVCGGGFNILSSQEEESKKERDAERLRVVSAAERNRRKVMEQEFGVIAPRAERPKSVSLMPFVKDVICDHKALAAESQRKNFEETSAQRRANRWNMLHGGTGFFTSAVSTVSERESSCRALPEATTARETPSDDGEVHDVLPSPASTDAPMSKSESSGSVNHVYKTASAQSSKTSSSYNISSIASSASFDMGSGKFSLNTPTSTDDGSIFTFKTNTTSKGCSYLSEDDLRPRREEGRAGVPYWRSCRLLADDKDAPVAESTHPPEHAHDIAEDSSNLSDGVDLTDFTFINVALQKSVAIPLYTQLQLANETVLKYFFQDLDLFGHFLNLRNFFFLMDGEYSRTLTSGLFHKVTTVQQPSHLFNYVVLRALLREALDVALSGNEENAKRLSFKVSFVPEHFHLTSVDVLECLSLRYETEWPLNVILTEQSLSKYNHIFAFLLKVRLVSWQLEENFKRLKFVGGRNFGGCSKQLHCVHLWRHEMTHFVRSVQNYIMATAVHSTWEAFEGELDSVCTLDDLYRTHVAYVKHILYKCFLYKHSRSLHSALMKIFNTILKFHVQLEASAWQRRGAENAALVHPDFHALAAIHDSFQNLAAMLYRFVDKLVHAGYQTHLCELLEMLNANGYYTAAGAR